MLLSKLINTGLFDKTVMKRLVGYNHYMSLSYNMNYDEYCVLPEYESVYQCDKEHGEYTQKSINIFYTLKLVNLLISIL